MTVVPSSCSDHPGLTHVLIRFGCGTLLSPPAALPIASDSTLGIRSGLVYRCDAR
jgi:hypothetical protein